MKGELKKLDLQDLRQRGKTRKTGKESEKRWKIPNMTLIGTHPAAINARGAGGRWEGNCGTVCQIIGKNHKPSILVTVERKSRLVQMDVLEDMDAPTLRRTMRHVCRERRFKKLETALRKSITFDQGKENSRLNT